MKRGIDLHRQRIPFRLLVVDAVGAALVAIGILDLLQAGPRLVPEVVDFPGVGIVLAVTGSLLMLPVPVWLLQRHRRRRRP